LNSFRQHPRHHHCHGGRPILHMTERLHVRFAGRCWTNRRGDLLPAAQPRRRVRYIIRMAPGRSCGAIAVLTNFSPRVTVDACDSVNRFGPDRGMSTTPGSAVGTSSPRSADDASKALSRGACRVATAQMACGRRGSRLRTPRAPRRWDDASCSSGTERASVAVPSRNLS
jgi:hypothetical protein